MVDNTKLDETFLPIGAVPPLSRSGILRFAAFEPRSFVAGPGERAVVWVAGCLRRCPGCMKPDLFDFRAGHDMQVEDVASLIFETNARRPLDGVTFSGGEPFEQALALSELAAMVRGAGLNVLVYTGYRLETLRTGPERFAPLLNETDICIDGEYRADLPGPLMWRGSENQNTHALTSIGATAMLDGESNKARFEREIQVSLTHDGVRLSGFPSSVVQRQLTTKLAERGIIVSPCEFPSREGNP